MAEEWPKFTCDTHMIADQYVTRVTCTYPQWMFDEAAVRLYTKALIESVKRDAQPAREQHTEEKSK